MAVDLHLHTTVSDGRRTPAQLVMTAAALGLSAIAVTDHDHAGGIAPARAQAQLAGLRLEVVAGAELTTLWRGHELHLLAYFVEPDSPGWADLLAHQRQARVRRLERFVQSLRAHGIPLDGARLAAEIGDASPGRPHLARVLVAMGVASSENQAFERYLGPKAATWVPREAPDPAAAIAAIHRAGGVASVAHPGATEGLCAPGALEELAAAGLDAVEVVHPAHSMTLRQHLLDRSRALGLLPSGGSDDHGPSPRGRTALGREVVPDAWLAALRARRPLEV